MRSPGVMPGLPGTDMLEAALILTGIFVITAIIVIIMDALGEIFPRNTSK